MKRVLGLVAAASMLVCGGCMSHYSGGPAYVAVTPPEGYAVVHIYRPKKAWGAMQLIEASQPGREAILPSGGYATFVVPVGPVTLKSAINTWSEVMVSYAPGAGNGVSQSSVKKATETPVAFDAQVGGVYFIRTEFTARLEAPSAKLVDAKTGTSDIEGLHLVAGGRGRYPVTPWAAAPAAPSATK